MGKLTQEVFNESCCDGGAMCMDSAQPCGCDRKANWVCEVHRGPNTLAIKWGPLLETEQLEAGTVLNIPSKERIYKNPRFHNLLTKMQEMHERKAHDYAKDSDPYSNFKEAAATAGLTPDDVFAVMIGVKLARLKELTGAGKKPNNESIQDTRIDLAVYAALWASYHETA